MANPVTNNTFIDATSLAERCNSIAVRCCDNVPSEVFRNSSVLW